MLYVCKLPLTKTSTSKKRMVSLGNETLLGFSLGLYTVQPLWNTHSGGNGGICEHFEAVSNNFWYLAITCRFPTKRIINFYGSNCLRPRLTKCSKISGQVNGGSSIPLVIWSSLAIRVSWSICISVPNRYLWSFRDTSSIWFCLVVMLLEYR